MDNELPIKRFSTESAYCELKTSDHFAPILRGLSFSESHKFLLNVKQFSADALLDTGADISSLPASLIREHKLHPQYRLPIRLPDGHISDCNIYMLEVRVPGLSSVVERFFDSGLDEVILGRPILNKWRIILNPLRKGSSFDLEIEE